MIAPDFIEAGPLQRLSGMLTAPMTAVAPRSGFTWHPHRGLEIYTGVLEGTLHHADLCAYVTDGAGAVALPAADAPAALGQYDVLLAQPNAPRAAITAGPDAALHVSNFYLPRFLN